MRLTSARMMSACCGVNDKYPYMVSCHPRSGQVDGKRTPNTAGAGDVDMGAAQLFLTLPSQDRKLGRVARQVAIGVSVFGGHGLQHPPAGRRQLPLTGTGAELRRPRCRDRGTLYTLAGLSAAGQSSFEAGH